MSDTNTLIEDSEIEVQLGDKAVKVRALNIESSIQWVKRVKRAMYETALKTAAAASKMNESVSGAPEVTEKGQFVALAEFDKMLNDGAACDLLVARDALIEHSKAMTPELVNAATAKQIVRAFHEVYALENPQTALRRALIS